MYPCRNFCPARQASPGKTTTLNFHLLVRYIFQYLYQYGVFYTISKTNWQLWKPVGQNYPQPGWQTMNERYIGHTAGTCTRVLEGDCGAASERSSSWKSYWYCAGCGPLADSDGNAGPLASLAGIGNGQLFGIDAVDDRRIGV